MLRWPPLAYSHRAASLRGNNIICMKTTTTDEQLNIIQHNVRARRCCTVCDVTTLSGVIDADGTRITSEVSVCIVAVERVDAVLTHSVHARFISTFVDVVLTVCSVTDGWNPLHTRTHTRWRHRCSWRRSDFWWLLHFQCQNFRMRFLNGFLLRSLWGDVKYLHGSLTDGLTHNTQKCNQEDDVWRVHVCWRWAPELCRLCELLEDGPCRCTHVWDAVHIKMSRASAPCSLGYWYIACCNYGIGRMKNEPPRNIRECTCAELLYIIVSWFPLLFSYCTYI